MFPLGTALVPGAELPLRIFEPRYRQMLDDHVDESTDPPTVRFGVVLIERGSEVGGGETRSEVGTMAHAEITGRRPDGRASLSAIGRRRFRVVEWLPDDPYPQARITVLSEQEPSRADLARLATLDERLNTLTRQRLTAAGEDPEPIIAALAIIDADPRVADLSPIHRWAARAVAQPHDQQRILGSERPSDQIEILDDVMQGLEARAVFGRF
ncbi:LON peptidase substrate-binding domain-containing protein [Gordonia sp. NPDC058843]|uniref:LON peptidase substrate-binding domain-containing protein n=1 Tax=Gordonia sp. NPDC058843 TaxID=3346648 RepID=UPI0036A49870